MTSVQMTTIFLLHALSHVAIFSVNSLLLGEVIGKITGNEFVYVGDELKLTCVLDSNEFTASNITFTVFYPFEINDTRICINQEHVYLINDSTAVLSVPNISRAGRAEYSCLVGSECINNIPSLGEWVASLDISVQYRPQNITNFTCVVFNFDENMNCTWQHPVKYDVNLNDTNVSLVYNTDQQRFHPCPQLNFNGCFWDHLTGSTQYIIEVNVTVKNTKDAASQIFIVKPSQNVKPAPVTDLLITNTTNKNEFLLSWNQTRYPQLLFQVFHKLPEEEDFKMIAINITAKNLTYELRPNTTHTFYVQCYPGNGYSGYWSDKTFYSHHTPEQPPSLGPETTNGSYSDLSGSCEGDRPRRKVMVFWMYVNESARNGVITSYSVKFEGKVLKNVSNASHSAAVEVSCYVKQPVDLEIAAVNSAGESTDPSVVRLAPISFQVPSKVKESFVIEWNGTNATAFWNGRDDNMNTSYTVFWCLEDTESPCKGPIYWRHVPEYQSHLDIPELPSKATDYRFGLAMRDGDNASGIQWTDCLFNPQPSSLPSPEILNIQPDTESATVVWQKIQCTKKNQILLTGYRVLWCQQQKCNDSSSIQNVDLAATSSSFKVSRLEANTIYNVAVLGKVHDQLGKELVWKEVTPKPPESKILVIVGSISPIVFVLSLLGAWVLYKKCQASRQRARGLLQIVETNYVSTRIKDINAASLDELILENRPVPINQTNNRSIAEIPSVVLNTDFDSSISDSSGRGSDSRSLIIKTPKKSQGAKSPKSNSKNDEAVPLPHTSLQTIPTTPEGATGTGMLDERETSLQTIPTTPEGATGTGMLDERETSLQDESDYFKFGDVYHQGLSKLHATSVVSHSTDNSSTGEQNRCSQQELNSDKGSADTINRKMAPKPLHVLQEENVDVSVGPNERKSSHFDSVEEYMTINQMDAIIPKVVINIGDAHTSPKISSSIPYLDSGTSLNHSMSKLSQRSLQSFPDDLNDIAILSLHSTF